MSKPLWWRLAPLMLLAFCLQTTWARGIRLGAASLDLAFVVALCAAMIGGPRAGMWAGLGAGYLAALEAMWHPGSFVVSRLVPCLIIGALASRFDASHPLAPPLCALGAAITGDTLWLLLSPADFPLRFWLGHALASGVLHALVAWPIFCLVKRLLTRSEKLAWN